MYLDYFGFREMPFTLQPDKRYNFIPQSRKTILNKIEEAVANGHTLMALIGNFGIGKTTLIHGVSDSLPANYLPILIFEQINNSAELIRSICEKLAIRTKNVAIGDLTDRLINRLKKEMKSGNKIVLILDDVHRYSKSTFETLQLLLRVNRDLGSPLSLLLVCQQEMELILREKHHKQLREQLHLKIYLHNFNSEETKQYINYRLAQAQIATVKQKIFTETALQKIYEFSDGLPRKINILCNNALLMAFLKSVTTVDEEIAEKVRFEDVCYLEIKELMKKRESEFTHIFSGESIREAEETAPEQVQEKTPVEVEEPDTAPTQPEMREKIIGEAEPSEKIHVPKSSFDRTEEKEIPPELQLFSPEVMQDLQRIVESMQYLSEGDESNVIGLTAAIPNQGVTTITTKLALMLSEKKGENQEIKFSSPGSGVIVIDANLRHPTIHEKFDLANKDGLCEILSNKIPLAEGTYGYRSTDLQVIPVGNYFNFQLTQNHIKIFKRLLNELKNRFKFIFIDLPPLLHDPKSISLSGLCDGVVMVIKAESCKWEVVDEAIRLLDTARVPIWGGILNKRKFYIPQWLYKKL